MIGRTLNHYRIIEKLGSGGMGEVYLAEDTRLSRRVALKVLPAQMAADADRRARFEREATSIAALSHPSIVTLYSVEEADGLTFLSMELLDGGSLSGRIPSAGLSVQRFLELAIRLTGAVAAAHEKGITHRDLKPENVLFTEEGRLKVVDFGLAKLREEFASTADMTQIPTTAETREGMILGTVAYMSPEQAQGQPVDPRSDVFSLGIILYEMIAGQRPFKGDNNISILSAILKDTPQPVHEIRHDLPGSLGVILQRALEKDPERRYATAAGLRQDLEALKQELDTSELASRISMPPSPAPRPRRGWLWVAATAALALAGVAFVWLGGGRAGDAPPGPAGGGPSLAVFYFENISGDDELDWLRTGLTDMIVTDLSQSSNVRVLDTARLFQILDRNGKLNEPQTSFEAVQAVAREAKVGTAVTGSFAAAGDRIRISARLQDARSGEIIDSETVEGTGEAAIFGMVDELTRRIKNNFGLDSGDALASDRDLTDVSTDSLEAYRYYAEGIRLHEQLKEQEALPLLEKAVDVDPRFAMALAKLSVVQGNLNNIELAREYAGKALEQIDRLSERERYYIEGRYYSLDPETLDKAIAGYEQAVRKFADHSSARNNLAQIYMEMGRTEQAVQHLQELRRRGMTFPGTYWSLSSALVSLGRMEEAHEVLVEYTRTNPDNAAGHRNLAFHLVGWGRYDEALRVLDTAEELEPGHADVLEARWAVHALREEWDAAERVARTMFERRDQHTAWQGGARLTMTLLYRGRLSEARALLDEALDSIAPTSQRYVQTVAFKAGLEHALGDYEASLRTAQAARGRVAQEPWMLAGLDFIEARALLSLDRSDEALDHVASLEQVIAMLPAAVADLRLAAIRGQLALASDDPRESLGHFNEAQGLLKPDLKLGGSMHAVVWYGTAEAYLALGEDNEALDWFRKVAQSDSHRLTEPVHFVRSLYETARLLENQGDHQQARRYYARYLDYWRDGEIDRSRIGIAQAKLGGV